MLCAEKSLRRLADSFIVAEGDDELEAVRSGGTTGALVAAEAGNRNPPKPPGDSEGFGLLLLVLAAVAAALLERRSGRTSGAENFRSVLPVDAVSAETKGFCLRRPADTESGVLTSLSVPSPPCLRRASGESGPPILLSVADIVALVGTGAVPSIGIDGDARTIAGRPIVGVASVSKSFIKGCDSE